MEFDRRIATADKNSELSPEGRAFVQLETARLRCEALMSGVGRRDDLQAIHRELGLAGYVTCEPFAAEQRRDCVALAACRVVEDPVVRGERPRPAPAEVGRALSKMFAETIAASDALAAGLSSHDLDDAHRDRLHLVHAHVMAACELLDERLTVLELANIGINAAN